MYTYYYIAYVIGPTIPIFCRPSFIFSLVLLYSNGKFRCPCYTIIIIDFFFFPAGADRANKTLLFIMARRWENRRTEPNNPKIVWFGILETRKFHLDNPDTSDCAVNECFRKIGQAVTPRKAKTVVSSRAHPEWYLLFVFLEPGLLRNFHLFR